MKKISLLVLALVVVLPGCGKKKESSQPVKRNTVAKYADIPRDEDIEDITELDEDMDSDSDSEDMDLDFDDLDIDDLLKDLEEGEDQDISIEDEYSSEDNLEAFNWIDAQTDDEFRKLYFSFNHYGISADQKDAVAYDVEQIKQLLSEADSAQPTVVVEGHACQEGTPAYNLALSEKRAKNVADLFVAAGIDKKLVKVVGRGQECPVVINGKTINGSREDRAPNRRVEVRVIYT
jgi:outer membrane protein OmpA-like peptidoglycan-associated protein